MESIKVSGEGGAGGVYRSGGRVSVCLCVCVCVCVCV